MQNRIYLIENYCSKWIYCRLLVTRKVNIVDILLQGTVDIKHVLLSRQSDCVHDVQRTQYDGHDVEGVEGAAGVDVQGHQRRTLSDQPSKIIHSKKQLVYQLHK